VSRSPGVFRLSLFVLVTLELMQSLDQRGDFLRQFLLSGNHIAIESLLLFTRGQALEVDQTRTGSQVLDATAQCSGSLAERLKRIAVTQLLIDGRRIRESFSHFFV
jgi:hypothetical protein